MRPAGSEWGERGQELRGKRPGTGSWGPQEEPAPPSAQTSDLLNPKFLQTTTCMIVCYSSDGGGNTSCF